MEILEVTGTSYPDARELPCKSGRPISKHQKSPAGGNSGSKHTRYGYLPKIGGKLQAEQQKADREITAASKMVMIIVGGRARKFISQADYRAGRF